MIRRLFRLALSRPSHSTLFLFKAKLFRIGLVPKTIFHHSLIGPEPGIRWRDTLLGLIQLACQFREIVILFAIVSVTEWNLFLSSVTLCRNVTNGRVLSRDWSKICGNSQHQRIQQFVLRLWRLFNVCNHVNFITRITTIMIFNEVFPLFQVLTWKILTTPGIWLCYKFWRQSLKNWHFCCKFVFYCFFIWKSFSFFFHFILFTVQEDIFAIRNLRGLKNCESFFYKFVNWIFNSRNFSKIFIPQICQIVAS